MEGQNTSTETPAQAADSSTTETTPEITPEISQDGATPSEENNGGDNTGAAEGEDLESFLDKFGSKVVDGLVVPGPDVPSKGAQADAALTAEAETPTGETATGETAAPAKEMADGTGKPPEKQPANNYRLNLKGAKDADKKRLVIEIMRDEPDVSVEEAMERAGIVVNAKAPAASTPETPGKQSEGKTEPETNADPFKADREAIAALEAEAEKAANEEFDYPKARTLDKQVAQKQRELDRKEAEQTARTQADRNAAVQKYQGDVNASWAQVQTSFPDAGKPGSPFYADLDAAIKSIYKATPDYFNDPGWPVELSNVIALRRGEGPAGTAAVKPQTPPVKPLTGKAPLVPKKPSVPAPVTGGTSSAPAGAQTSALDAEDFLEMHGTKLKN